MDLLPCSATGCLPCPAPSHRTALSSLPSSWPRPARLCAGGRLPLRSGSGPLWPVSSRNSRSSGTLLRPRKRACARSRCAAGAAAGRAATFPWRISRDAGASPPFPPLDQAIVQAIACEVVCATEQPLSRQSLTDLTQRVRTALSKPISRSSVWRILHSAALKPWQYEYWIFPRDPQFAEKAAVILDLYAGLWQGQPLTAKDYILSSDEKTSIQARLRCHPSLAPAPGRPRRVEFEYDRGGALQYLAAWDVRRGYVMGRCEARTGIEPFGLLVRSGHGAGAVPLGGASLLDRRQRVVASRPGFGREADASVSPGDPGAYSRACQLAQSGRDLLLAGATEGPHAK